MSNVPHLRFPEFRGEWESSRLSSFAKKITKKNKGNIISNVLCNSANFGIIPQSEYFDRGIANTENTDTYYIIENGDFVYNPRKSVTAPYGPVNMYKGKNLGIISPLYLCFTVKDISKDFLLNWFKGNKWHRYVYSHGDTGVRYDRVSIKDDIFLDMPINIPVIAEQEKISKTLNLLEERIATQNKVIEKYKSLIKGIYDKILWQGYKQTSLSGILDERNERTTINNQYQVLSSTAKGLYRQSDYFDKEVASVNNIGYKVLRLGDIVLSPQNLWLGNINYNDAFEIGIVSPSYKVFSIREDYNPYFVSCFLKTPKALYEYANASEQGASIVRRNLDINAFMAICFPMPDRIMQDKVSERLRAINVKFDIEKQILEKLNIEKQYLLRQMFI